MASAKDSSLVLITGANGNIGYPVVVHALKAGYRVRAAIRSQAKADTVLSGPSISSLPAEMKAKLTFAIVPDLLDPHAYDSALADVEYVIHVASPTPAANGGSDYEERLIQPAVKGTMNMLEAAERSGTVKRVVVTSSVVAMFPWEEFSPATPTPDKTYTEASRTVDPTGPYNSEGEGYLASKVLALNTAEKWLKEKKRNISVVHIHPAIVLGKTELSKSVEDVLGGSSGRVVAQVTGKADMPKIWSTTVWLEDVAEMHVRALNDSVPNGQSLVGSADGVDGIVWTSGSEIVKKKFPTAVEKGLLPKWKDGWAETKVLHFDVSETERLLGMKFEGFERQVGDVVGQYLELIGEEVA